MRVFIIVRLAGGRDPRLLQWIEAHSPHQRRTSAVIRPLSGATCDRHLDWPAVACPGALQQGVRRFGRPDALPRNAFGLRAQPATGTGTQTHVGECSQCTCSGRRLGSAGRPPLIRAAATVPTRTHFCGRPGFQYCNRMHAAHRHAHRLPRAGNNLPGPGPICPEKQTGVFVSRPIGAPQAASLRRLRLPDGSLSPGLPAGGVARQRGSRGLASACRYIGVTDCGCRPVIVRATQRPGTPQPL